MTVAVMYDEKFKGHECQYPHPERPQRLDAIMEGLESSSTIAGASRIDARPATEEELHRVHDPRYVSGALDAISSGGWGSLDPDTFFSPGTREAALCAAGGGVDLAIAVQLRLAEWGWALPRPPGHHANAVKAGGFCIFNNIAVAAAALLEREDVRRVAIFDWDVHHGNGTQDQFWDDPNLLYVSLHQWPHYPGSGLSEQIGGKGAEGRTINFPLPSGCGDRDYLAVVDEVIAPVLAEFGPDHLLVSAGFDGHERDPLAGHEATSGCYGEMASRMKGLADSLCGGRLTLFLEGGYDLTALRESAAEVADGIASPTGSPSGGGATSQGNRVISATRSKIAPFWPGLF
jgi:acetoin utilization deacetylase AcuC-like enzyme